MTKPAGRALRGIIFDIDGTLVDSNDLHTQAWQEGFAHFGCQVSFDEIRTHIGKGGDLLVPDLLDARQMREFGEKLQKYRRDLFRKKYLPEVRPFQGVPEALQHIHAIDLPFVFASSSDEEEVEHYIELLGVKDILISSTSKKDARFSKPSPEIFEAALERIGTPEEKTFVAGDTPYDILAAHRCALPIVAVRCGGFPENELTKAELLMNDVPELVGRLQELDDYFARG